MNLTLDQAVIPALETLALLVLAYLLQRLGGRAIRRSVEDPIQRTSAARLLRGIAFAVLIAGLVVIWRPFGGSLVPALGLATAGLAFAMQEVVGAVAGWFNITFGGIFRVGDRIQMADVHGDVIDITLLKTRLMEVGSPAGDVWVHGRQYTGRVVSISNKATFTAPVYNYSSYFDYIWEELEFAIPHHGRWQDAVRILEEEASGVSSTAGARAAMEETRRRFPVPAAEVEPTVYVSSDPAVMRLAVRFVVPIRTGRAVRDLLTRRVTSRLEAAGIEVVGTQVVEQAREPWEPIGPREPRQATSREEDRQPGEGPPPAR